jgi:hypothetical protein
MASENFGNSEIGRKAVAAGCGDSVRMECRGWAHEGRRTSALVRIPDSSRTSRDVRKVPTTEVADPFNYFVGAREQRGGISMRSALVVLRLIGGRTSSVARWENRSASHPGSHTGSLLERNAITQERTFTGGVSMSVSCQQQTCFSIDRTDGRRPTMQEIVGRSLQSTLGRSGAATWMRGLPLAHESHRRAPRRIPC